ncbi:hypothetical protein [Nostoc commune]|nr:hypothetical protein [Nostoc commune]
MRSPGDENALPTTKKNALIYGYNITTHFRYDQQKRQSATLGVGH